MKKIVMPAVLLWLVLFPLTTVEGDEIVIGIQFNYIRSEIDFLWDVRRGPDIDSFDQFYERTPHCNRTPRLETNDIGSRFTRSFTPCMAEYVLEMVNERFAVLRPEVSIRFETAGIREMTPAEEALLPELDMDPIARAIEFVNLTRSNHMGNRELINVWMIGVQAGSRRFGGATCGNCPLNAELPTSIVMLINEQSPSFTDFILSHELGHVMGSYGHLTEDMEISIDGRTLHSPSFTTLRNDHGIKMDCGFFNVMGSKWTDCDESTQRRPQIARFNTPIHEPILKDMFTGWLYSSNLAPLPQGWPNSRQSLSVAWDRVAHDEDIRVYFIGAARSTDWIGIYPAGRRPSSNSPSLMWYYVGGRREARGAPEIGMVRFPGGSLSPGNYDIWFLANDGHTPKAGPLRVVAEN